MMKRVAILIPILLVVLATIANSQSLNRREAIAMLKGCARSSYSEGCNEGTAEYLIGLYKRGDRTLLPVLLDAGLVSDGALSESLGSFYGELLWKKPEVFLAALATRPKKQQHKLAWLAAAMDGSGMPEEMLRGVRVTLRRTAFGSRNRLSAVAKLCLWEVNRVNNGMR